jgi:hypothetical protein
MFHPGVGQFNLTINGEPVAEPLARLAAIPTVAVILCLGTLLALLMFLGISAVIFLAVLAFSVFAIMLVAPFFWPILAVILLVITLMSVAYG